MQDKLLTTSIGEASEEYKDSLINALIAAVRWYAVNEDKRRDDHNHAVTLLNLVEDLRS